MRQLAAFWQMAKPRIGFMCLITTTIGFFLGGQGLHAVDVFIATLIGTGLAASGAGILNNYLERDIDALMERTRGRPLPSGHVEPGLALGVGVLLILAGVTVLVLAVNLLSAFIVLLTAFLYVVVYTPLKRVTWLNTPIGAIPGALPPLSGWAAATGDLGLGAWILFAILFVWQHPHFYSIAWMFRDDYARAGFRMLPVVDPSGRRLFRQSVLYAVALIGVSLALSLTHLLGPLYLVGCLALGLVMLASCVAFARSGTHQAARRVLLTSVAYLPALLTLIVVDFLLSRPAL